MKSTIKLTKTRSAHQRHKHNAPLIESILISFTIFLSLGLLLIMIVNFSKDCLSNHFHQSTQSDEDSWEHVHHHGQTKVTKKTTNRPFNVFKYQYTTDLPYKSLVDMLNDPLQYIEWFAWTVPDEAKSEIRKKEENPSSLEYTRVQMKIPYLNRHNREFILDTSNEISVSTHLDEGARQYQTAQFQYKTIDDDRIKASCADCKKGELELNLTLVTLDESKHTDVQMTLYMNFHSTRIPTFIMNNVSKEWGYISLMKLIKLCHSNLGLKDTAEMKMTFYNLFPVKR